MNTKNISLSNSEKIGLISNFATMLAAGIPILETVESLLEDAKGNQKKLLEALRNDLNQGNHVWACFSKFPGVFDKVTVNIIKASEQAGTLDVTLKDLKGNIQNQIEFNDKVRAALTYPVIILFVFVGVLLMMLVVVIPKIGSVFERLNVPLPLPTKVLIFSSKLLLNYTIPLIIGTVVVGVLFMTLYKKNRRFVFQALSSLPVVSQLVKEIDLTRFTRSLYLLLSSGIPITTALEFCQDVVTKKEIRDAIAHSQKVVLAGKKLSDGFKDNKKVIPGIMIKITEAGERSGSLDRSMQDISTFLDYQVSNTLRTLMSLLEPIMLVGVGLLVGGMMLSIIAPIYGIISQVGGR